MTAPFSPSSGGPSRNERTRRDTAAAWVVRHDRGLSADERHAFAEWLREDPANEAAWRRSAAVWGRFEGHVPAPVPEVRKVPPGQKLVSLRWLAGGLAAAAALVVGAYLQVGSRMTSANAVASVVPAEAPQTRVLADGTLARLNAGAILTEGYSDTERRVRLVQGEAYFAVTKDGARPFIVEAAGVRVRAVGTAFGVALQDQVVDVLVTEGTVKVAPSEAETHSEDHALAPLVTAGHRAVVARQANLASSAVVVSEVDMVEVNRANSWRGGLLRLGGATLAELALEFERQTGRKLEFADAGLGAIRVGGRFPSNDVEGFVRVLEEHHGVVVERKVDGTLILDRAR